jgi:hypothetical protein
MLSDILGFLLYFTGLISCLLIIGAWLDRVERRHLYKQRQQFINKLGD